MLKSAKARIYHFVDKGTNDGRTYIFLTKSGFYFCFLVFVLFVISLSYGNSLAFFCSFLFISVIWISCIITNYNLSGIEFVSIEKDDFYFEGEDAWVNVRLKNTGEKIRFDIEASLVNKSDNFIAQVGPGESFDLNINLGRNKRSIKTFRRGSLKTGFPFGLFQSWKPFSYDGEVLIIPKPETAPFPNKSFDQSEEGHIRNLNAQDEFYQHSKDKIENVSRIDWKIYARRDELYSKDFDSSSVERHEFTDHIKLEQLTYYLLEAHRRGDLYSLNISGKVIPAGRGRVHLMNCLREVATK